MFEITKNAIPLTGDKLDQRRRDHRSEHEGILSRKRYFDFSVMALVMAGLLTLLMLKYIGILEWSDVIIAIAYGAASAVAVAYAVIYAGALLFTVFFAGAIIITATGLLVVALTSPAAVAAPVAYVVKLAGMAAFAITVSVVVAVYTWWYQTYIKTQMYQANHLSAALEPIDKAHDEYVQAWSQHDEILASYQRKVERLGRTLTEGEYHAMKAWKEFREGQGRNEPFER